MIVKFFMCNKSAKSILFWIIVVGALRASIAYAGQPSKLFNSSDIDTKISQNKSITDTKLQSQVLGTKKIIVKFQPGTSKEKRLDIHKQFSLSVHAQLKALQDFDIVELAANADVADTIKQYKQLGSVAYVEPDMLVQILTPPNDPDLSQLWGMHNTGQTGGSADADVNALEAWGITQGDESLVLAVIDSGIAYDHEDLQANMWVNPGEIANNGIDDDGNGYIDDVYGIDTINNDADPYDDHSHGTHVAGTIAAVGDNGIGVAGVNWRAKLVACKFIGSSGYGSLSAAVECLDYLLDLKQNHHVNLIATNNSWGGGGYSQALYEAIQRHREAGILFVAAAGNSTTDNDRFPAYPSSYDLANIISVAATDHQDQLAWFSSYGRRTVDVAAPGVDVWSTVLNHGYDHYSGTSMATPHVAGLVGLLKAHDPTYNAQQIKSLILTSGTPLDHLRDKVLSGRRIRAWGESGRGALTCQDQDLQARVSPLQDTVLISVGEQLNLTYMHMNCANYGSDIQVHVSPGNTYIDLLDDGQNDDQVANDGLFTSSFTLRENQSYTLTFPNQETVVIHPLQPYAEAELVPYTYKEISGTRLDIQDEDVRLIESPFPLHFSGSEFGNRLYVSGNGAISFSQSYVPWWNDTLPSMHIAESAILPLWGDWWMAASDKGVFWDVIGTSPERQLVIEWRNVQHFNWRASGGGHASFQVILTENSSDIAVNYKDTTVGHHLYDHGSTATVGVQQSYDVAQQYSFNEPIIPDMTSMVWKLANPGAPVIENVQITGHRRITHTISFQIDAFAVDNKSISQYEVDFDGDGVFDDVGSESATTYVYDEISRYEINIRVVDSEGLSDEWSSVLDIEDLTLEEKIARAVSEREEAILADPSLLGLYSQTDVDQAYDAGVTSVIANPEAHGLYSDSAMDQAVHERESEIIADPSLLGLYSQTDVDQARAAGSTTLIVLP